MIARCDTVYIFLSMISEFQFLRQVEKLLLDILERGELCRHRSHFVVGMEHNSIEVYLKTICGLNFCVSRMASLTMDECFILVLVNPERVA